MANSLAHSKWVCKYHVVFTPKYRRKIDYWGMREDIRDIIRDLCKGKGNAGPHPSVAVDTTEVFRIQFHGVSEGKKCDDDFRAARKFEVSIREAALLGDRILREHSGVTGESDTEVYPRARETGSDRG